MKYKKAIAILLIAIIILAIVLIASLLIYYCGKTAPEYTWEEFEALTPEEQMKFQDSFKNEKEFEEWMEEAQRIEIDVPWENGGKKPKDYAWEEFEALTSEQQIVFQDSFKNHENFEKWMKEALETKIDIPWENGGKKPEDYTWEEFEALTAEQQIVFQNSFKNQEKFDEWFQTVNPDEIPENEEVIFANWNKPLEEYTWEEFEAFTSEEQMAFQNSFESYEDFKNWMESVNGSEKVEMYFENNDLFDVTWEEFEAMTGEEQMIFQNSFGNFEEFDKWLKANEPK